MALFGGSKPDHPMADIKVARKLIAELPVHDSLKALDEINFWLDSIKRTEGFRIDYSYELYGLLDQAAKTHQRKLSQEYLATDRKEKFRENKLWTTLYTFWTALGAAYGHCVEQFQAGAGGSNAIRKEIPVICARMLRALTLQLKWTMLRYNAVEDRIWGELGRIYLFVETKSMTTTPIDMYPGAHGRSTLQQEFLKAMMLGISSTDGLTPDKQEIAERIVAHFGGLYDIQRRPSPGCNYFFDLTMRKPAARVLKRVEPTTSMRYFGAGDAMPALKQVYEETQTKRAVPSDINLGGTYPYDLVLGVMQHLAQYWSGNPPARYSERRKIASRMTVAHGFHNVVQALAPASQEPDSLDFNVDDGTESWIVENVSDGGFGAIVPQVQGDWVEVGNLLGVRTETAKFWGAGVIRRITGDEYNQRRVGIQVLSSAVIPVTLAPVGATSRSNATRAGDPALLLSTTPDPNGEIALLMRAHSYTSGQALEMTVNNKRYLLAPIAVNETGEDFDWVRFKIDREH